MTEVLAGSEGSKTHAFRVKSGVLDLAVAAKRIPGNGRKGARKRGKKKERCGQERNAAEKSTEMSPPASSGQSASDAAGQSFERGKSSGQSQLKKPPEQVVGERTPEQLAGEEGAETRISLEALGRATGIRRRG